MKVLHVLNHFLPQQTAGTEIYVWALSKHLSNFNIECAVVIPNYNSNSDLEYYFDDLKVFCYSEPTVVTRESTMGMIKPLGLINFERIIRIQNPDIVHFHELAGSIGIGLHHFDSANKYGAKVIMTFHLAGNTCKSDTMLYNGLKQCDGLINNRKCSTCYLNTKKIPNQFKIITPFLVAISSVFNFFKINPYTWKTHLGTALSTTQQIAQLKDNLNKDNKCILKNG